MLKDLYNTLADEVHSLDEKELSQVYGGNNNNPPPPCSGPCSSGDGLPGGGSGSNTGAHD
ncbi:MAG: bacteriocin [Kordiimonadaceae bacterium]|nr:bacteriocin [Kordiimonadaceae bacterium]MBO6569214.1 bacteriocin [Kordiimonadaceae bacterium]MBO6964690.1 bacteriocin [Kordiimonadaceae bacterium]